MNPITNAKNQNLMNERELRLGYTGSLSSWHRQYKDSAWIYVGGLNRELTEGDVVCVFSQYGEIANVNLVRDRKTGVSKGFAFICYENQKSTVLATDNLNAIKLAGRTIRVDHVEQYRVPKDDTSDPGPSIENTDKKRYPVDNSDTVTSFVREHGCGPEVMQRIKELEEQQKKIDADKSARHEAKKRSSEHRWKDRSNRSPHNNGHRNSHSSHNPLYSRENYPRSKQWSPSRKRKNSSPSHNRQQRLSPCSPPRRQKLSPPSPPRRRKLSPPTPPRLR